MHNLGYPHFYQICLSVNERNTQSCKLGNIISVVVSARIWTVKLTIWMKLTITSQLNLLQRLKVLVIDFSVSSKFLVNSKSVRLSKIDRMVGSVECLRRLLSFCIIFNSFSFVACCLLSANHCAMPLLGIARHHLMQGILRIYLIFDQRIYAL